MRTSLGALLLAGCSAAMAGPPRDPEQAIQPAEALREVEWLAAPERTGRGVGTPGNAASAEHLAAEMKAIGLAPAGDQGSYFERFDAPVEARLQPGNALQVGKVRPPVGELWQPFTFSDNGDAKGELVWAGYGVTAPELGYDDYAGLDVKGKIVLVAAHFPRESDPASPFRAPKALRYAEWRYKAMNAREHGAAALLAVRDDWNHPGPDVLPKWSGTVASRSGVVAAQATLSALRSAAVDAAELAKPGQGDGKPHSKALGMPAELSVRIEQLRAPTENVLGLLPGTDPKLKSECVVVGAHFDHLGYGGESSLAPEVHAVHPGADDNASGTAGLIEIARAFTAAGGARRTLLFAAFSGEELGLLGSARLVKDPPAACPIEKMQLMVNLDMIGRPQHGKVFVYGVDTAAGLRERVAELAKEPPALPLELAEAGDGYGPSDHTSFYAKGVPVLFFFTGAHADYHRPSDTADKIDAAGLAEVAKLAWRAARDAADRSERLVVKRAEPRHSATGGEGGYGAYLGTIPDFAERTEPGVLISGVRPGSPAEKAGLAAGDVLTKLGGVAIANLYDMTYALRAHRPGDVVEIEWTHGAQKRSAKATLGERR